MWMQCAPVSLLRNLKYTNVTVYYTNVIIDTVTQLQWDAHFSDVFEYLHLHMYVLIKNTLQLVY